jgi:hypothetical protein
MPLSASCFLASSLFSRCEFHGLEHFGCLSKLNIAIFYYFDPVAPGIEEIKKITFEQSGAGGADEVTNTRAIIHNEAEMPVLVRMRRTCFHQRYELIAHINESSPFASPSQLEGEDLAVEGECLINVTNFQGNMVQANKPRLRF